MTQAQYVLPDLVDDAKYFLSGNAINLELRAGAPNQIHSPLHRKPTKNAKLIVGNIKMRFIQYGHIGVKDNE